MSTVQAETVCNFDSIYIDNLTSDDIKQIYTELGLSKNTVYNHLKNYKEDSDGVKKLTADAIITLANKMLAEKASLINNFLLSKNDNKISN